MKSKKTFLFMNINTISLIILGFICISFLLLFKLGSLTHGLSSSELFAINTPVGWHGIFHSPLYLPLKFFRSIIFSIFPSHGYFLSRLPNVKLGGLSIIAFSWLIYLWHGRRTAILGTILFSCSAWTLHISRLASFDAMYMFAILYLLLGHALLYRYKNNLLVWYFNIFIWGMLLFVPGFIWFIILDIFLQRKILKNMVAKLVTPTSQVISSLLILIWFPLLIIDLIRPHELISWMGLPNHFPTIHHLAKNFIGIFVHIFIRGPQYPELWLNKSPVLDVFTLTMTLLGIFFYVKRRESSRSHWLAYLSVITTILISLSGPVSFSLIVPLVYIISCTGIAYIMHTWLSVFPTNPIARNLGIGLVSLAVLTSCSYNLKSYFIAWPNNIDTKTTFSYHL